MKLPLTPAQAAWFAKQKEAHAGLRFSEDIPNLRKSDSTQRRCMTCRYMRFHTFSERHNYCAKFKSNRTQSGFAKTKRNNVCDMWEEKK